MASPVTRTRPTNGAKGWTTVSSVDRTSPNAVTWDLTGTVTGGGFHNVPVSMIIDATQSGGPGNVISVSGSNSSSSTSG